jgi:pyruvate kinase
MTNILSTIGPATENSNNLRKIVNHSKFVRLNGAHNDLFWHKKICSRIKKINPSCKILIDLPGIKPRTLNSKNLLIKKNQKIIFYFGKKKKINDVTQIQISKPLPKFKKPLSFSVSDGKFIFKFISKGKNYIIGKSKEQFTLLSKKGLNIPFSIYDNKFQEKVYLDFLKKIKNFNFDAIGLSYVQDHKLVDKMRYKSNKIIVSKIENDQGCKNMSSICQSSDIIMIDRGDLAAEIGDTNLYNQTIKISKCAKYYGKLLIMATENLETMILNNAPTKSEIISLSFSKSLNADYLMLSDETATSKKFLKIINWLKNFNNVHENQKINSKKNNKLIPTKDIFFSNLSKINEKDNKIIVFTRKGYVIEKILSINPSIEMIIFTDNQKVYDLSYLRMNSLIFKTSKFPISLDKFIYFNISSNKKIIFKNNKNVCLLYAAFARKNSRANTLSILEKKDFR